MPAYRFAMNRSYPDTRILYKVLGVERRKIDSDGREMDSDSREMDSDYHPNQ